jgi:NADH-quinone oxidoreductase subunit H
MPQLIVSIIVALTIMHVFLLGTAYLILLERKIASWAQDRIGPNRVGPQGLLQPIADGLKFLMKEDYNPGNVDKTLFLLAPVLAVIPALVGWAVIPWGGILDFPGFSFPAGAPLVGGLSVPAFSAAVSVADINVGVIFILAIGSLAVYGITIGAWASNNKYAFLGGLRATAQMLSYEIPMGLCVLVILLMAGTSQAEQIVETQVGYWYWLIPKWNIFQQPIAAILFFTCSLAESNRAPFDLAECEQELIGGFHTEYSSMKFAMFFLGEYMHMATASAFFSVLFLGGWHLPWLDYLIWHGPQPAVSGGSPDLLGVILAIVGTSVKLAVFLGKVVVLISVMMWIRWTLPRFRFDQLMRLAWRGLIPISITLLLVTGIMVYYNATGYLWLANLVLIAVFMKLSTALPDPAPVNRRIALEGSRFSPLPAE